MSDILRSQIHQAPPLGRLLAQWREVSLFGAGGSGLAAKRFLQQCGIKVRWFFDNDPKKQGQTVEGIPVKPASALEADERIPVLIASDWGLPIARQLRRLGIKTYYDFNFCFDTRYQRHFDAKLLERHWDALEHTASLLRDAESRQTFWALVRYRATLDPFHLCTAKYDQYFAPAVHPEPGDHIIDAGAWIGDTALQFLRAIRGRGRIYCFEPGWRNFQRLLRATQAARAEGRLIACRAGLWNEPAELVLKTNLQNTGRTHICRPEDGNETARFQPLDAFVEERGLKVTLIKVDTEGAEVPILLGAAQTLKRQKPKLQVCVYHRAEDLWRIPALIWDMNPEYRFLLAHHSYGIFETVLYAY